MIPWFHLIRNHISGTNNTHKEERVRHIFRPSAYCVYSTYKFNRSKAKKNRLSGELKHSVKLIISSKWWPRDDTSMQRSHTQAVNERNWDNKALWHPKRIWEKTEGPKIAHNQPRGLLIITPQNCSTSKIIVWKFWARSLSLIWIKMFITID